MNLDFNKLLSEGDRRDIERAYSEAKKERGRVASFLCVFGLHRFSKWWVTSKGDVTRGEDVVGKYTEQKRICFGCGIVKMRDERNCG